MTLALYEEPPTRRHVERLRSGKSMRRKCRVSREHLFVVRPELLVRSAARRQSIPAGLPKALSWDVLPWEYDDYAWYVTSVHAGLTSEQVAELIGISNTRVQQLEIEALEKLSLGFAEVLRELGIDPDDLPADFLRAAFALHDRRRLDEALAREREVTEPNCTGPRAL